MNLPVMLKQLSRLKNMKFGPGLLRLKITWPVIAAEPYFPITNHQKLADYVAGLRQHLSDSKR